MTASTVPYQRGRGAGTVLAGIKMLDEVTRPIRKRLKLANLQRTAAIVCVVSLVTAITIGAYGPEIGIGLRVVTLAGVLYLGYSRVGAWAGKKPNVVLVGLVGYAAHHGAWTFFGNIDVGAAARTAVLWSGLVWGAMWLWPHAVRKTKRTFKKR